MYCFSGVQVYGRPSIIVMAALHAAAHAHAAAAGRPRAPRPAARGATRHASTTIIEIKARS